MESEKKKKYYYKYLLNIPVGLFACFVLVVLGIIVEGETNSSSGSGHPFPAMLLLFALAGVVILIYSVIKSIKLVFTGKDKDQIEENTLNPKKLSYNFLWLLPAVYAASYGLVLLSGVIEVAITPNADHGFFFPVLTLFIFFVVIVISVAVTIYCIVRAIRTAKRRALVKKQEIQ